jgi:hypothetical protein
MQRTLSVLTAILVVLVALPTQTWAANPPKTVSWRDLGALTTGKKIALVLPDGRHVKGRVKEVRDDKLLLNKDVEIPRASVRAFTMTAEHTRWKVIGTVIGLGVGLAVAAPVNAYAHNEGDGAPGAVAAIIAVPTAIGFLAGRSADRHTVTVTVVD